MESWIGTIQALGGWSAVETWTGTISTPALPQWYEIEAWNGTIQTPPPSGAWYLIESWTGSAGAIWYETESWAGAIVAPADVWSSIEAWDGIVGAGVPPSGTPPVEISNPNLMIGIAIFLVCLGISAAIVFARREREEL